MTYDKETVIRQVQDEIGSRGSWYLDWGIASDIYKNCPTRGLADDIANKLKSYGFDIYINSMDPTNTWASGKGIMLRFKLNTFNQ